MPRNGWTACVGMGGRHGSESVDGMDRNQWTACPGIGGRHASESARRMWNQSPLRGALSSILGRKWRTIRLVGGYDRLGLAHSAMYAPLAIPHLGVPTPARPAASIPGRTEPAREGPLTEATLRSRRGGRDSDPRHAAGGCRPDRFRHAGEGGHRTRRRGARSPVPRHAVDGPHPRRHRPRPHPDGVPGPTGSAHAPSDDDLLPPGGAGAAAENAPRAQSRLHRCAAALGDLPRTRCMEGSDLAGRTLPARDSARVPGHLPGCGKGRIRRRRRPGRSDGESRSGAIVGGNARGAGQAAADRRADRRPAGSASGRVHRG